MIDIHCHILPGIDDGAETTQESLDMCQIAVDDGIKVIVATPHFTPGRFEPASTTVFSLIDALQKQVDEARLDLKILSGADLAVSPEYLAYIESHEHITINKSSKYVLAELPHAGAPIGWEDFLFKVIDAGITPILTHPERNPSFMKDPLSLRKFVDYGGLVQVTAMSITGDFGKDIQVTVATLLKEGLVHVIATDAHSTENRIPVLSEAVDMASDIVGKDVADAFVTTVPQAIVDGVATPSLYDHRSQSHKVSRI